MQALLEAGSEISVVFELNNKVNVDVYIYASTDASRPTATISLV